MEANGVKWEGEVSGRVEFGFCFETGQLAGEDEFPRPITKRFRANRRIKSFFWQWIENYSDVNMDQLNL